MKVPTPGNKESVLRVIGHATAMEGITEAANFGFNEFFINLTIIIQ
jgi:hypothetical protein